MKYLGSMVIRPKSIFEMDSKVIEAVILKIDSSVVYDGLVKSY